MTLPRLAAFRCDAGRETGAGHLVRCGALARALRDKGWHTLLLTRPETRRFLALAEGAFDGVVEIARTASGAEIAQQVRGRFDRVVVVVDDYAASAAFEAELAEQMPVVVFDDAPARARKARLLVDPTPGRTAGDYAALVPPECTLLTGPRHAILRTPFRKARRPRGEDDARRGAGILVSFGGTDPLGLIPETVARLRQAMPERYVAVVCGGEVAAALDVGSDRRVRVLADVAAADLARLMDESALAVGAAGTVSWERCACGLPSVVTAVVDNQRDNARGLQAAGAATVLPSGRFEAELADACRDLVESGPAYSAMSAAARLLCDGQGAERVAAAVENLVGPAGAPLGAVAKA